MRPDNQIDPANWFRVYPPVNDHGIVQETRFTPVETAELEGIKRDATC